jgi:uracil-DNA glycosylase
MTYESALKYVLENLEMRRALGDLPVPALRSTLTRLIEPLSQVAPPVVVPVAKAAAPVPPPAAVPIVPPTPVPVARVAEQPPPQVSVRASKAERMAALREIVLPCMKCVHLARSRTQVVFGVGNAEADLLFVGEAPGADEDRVGEPFVGAAGKLLTRVIETMGFKRGDVYIANVLKCRPDMPDGESGNRPPTPAEMETCLPYLQEQIKIIQPKVMVALGTTAMAGLFPGFSGITKNRGKWHDFGGIPVMPTYHPSYLLRNQAISVKRQVWEDMLLVKERLGHTLTERDRSYFLPKNTG